MKKNTNYRYNLLIFFALMLFKCNPGIAPIQQPSFLHRINLEGTYLTRIIMSIEFEGSIISLDTSFQKTTIVKIRSSSTTDTFEVRDSSDTIICNSIFAQNDSGLFLVNAPFGMEPSLYKVAKRFLKNSTIPVLYYFLRQGEPYTKDTIYGEALKKTYLGIENVKVPLGLFKCHVIESDVNPNEKKYYYFTDFGIVKKVDICDSIPQVQIDSTGKNNKNYIKSSC